MISMDAPSKWFCPKCKVGIPYNPTYDMSNTLCSNCAAHDNAQRLLQGYKWSHRQ